MKKREEFSKYQPLPLPEDNQQLPAVNQDYATLLRGVESIKDYAIISLDAEGHIITWNKGAERIKGYTAEEIIGQSFEKFYKPDALPQKYPKHELAEAKRVGHFEDEGWRLRKDGSSFWANVIITPIYNKAGEHSGYIKVTRDLTERKLAKDKLETLQQGVDSIMDYAILMLDTEGHIITWNKGAERIKGYTAGEIIGQSFEKFYQAEALQREYPKYELAEARRVGHFEDEGWRLRKDGSTFWANVIITPIYNETSKHVGYIKVTRDLTERKRAEATLAKSERNYRTIAELSPVGIFHINAEAQLIYVNERACVMMGLTAKEAKDKGWTQAIHPKDYARVSAEWTQALQSHAAFKSEFRFKRRDGITTWVISQGRPEINANNHMESYIQAVTDIQDRKALEKKERQRLEAVKKAEQEEEARLRAEDNKKKQEEFIDTICHEIRNPLTGISCGADLLEEDLKKMDQIFQQEAEKMSPSQAKDFYLTVVKASDHLETIQSCAIQQKIIVDDVLDLSKFETKKIELKPAPFILEELFSAILQMFQPQIKQKNLTVQLDLPPATAILKADPYRLSQVIINLLSNALKFTERGTIKINAKLETSTSSEISLRIALEDTGIGMSPRVLPRLFERFNKAHDRNASSGGSGLGLAICKHLVEAMGGSIEVSSKKGKGTAFSFFIKCQPLSAEEELALRIPNIKPEKTARNSPLTSPTAYGHKTVLIVDDNRINQKILAEYLGKKEYIYEIAMNGKEAIEKYEQYAFDIIFMDIEMPVMNGLEATRLIREKEQISNRHTPIVALSGNVREAQKEEAYKAGIDDYLTKPYHKEEVYGLIQKFTTEQLPRLVKEGVTSVEEKKRSPYKSLTLFNKSTSAAAPSIAKSAVEKFKTQAEFLIAARYPFTLSMAEKTLFIHLSCEKPRLSERFRNAILTELKQHLQDCLQPHFCELIEQCSDHLALITQDAKYINLLKEFMERAGFYAVPAVKVEMPALSAL